jgi:protein-tyrosine-phosphatase
MFFCIGHIYFLGNMNILFVCTANICRSFLAAKLFQNEIDLGKLENISVLSAGLFTRPGSPPDPKMVKFLSKMGIRDENHRSRQMSEEDIVWADMILVMEEFHRLRILSLWPSGYGKVERLGRFVSGDSVADDIADPYGRSQYHYRLAQSQISLSIKNLANTMASDPTIHHLKGAEILKHLREA